MTRGRRDLGGAGGRGDLRELWMRENVDHGVCSLAGLTLTQVVFTGDHSDAASRGGEDTRGGGEHVSGGEEDAPAHVSSSTCHRHQPGELARLRGPPEQGTSS